ncbi:MAG: SCO family protein [Gammaproteobacteria bacterium]
MAPKPARLALAVAALAAAALGALAATFLYAPVTVPQPVSGTRLAEPRPVAAFELSDQDGKDFTNAGLQGHWTLLFAGFTHCPDVCPTTLGLMKQLRRHAALRDQPLEYLFLSVDPERDTPTVLKTYVDYFGGAIRGVSGPREQVDALCASLGLAYVKIPGARQDDYTVDHSAALVLIDDRGRVAGYFQPPHKLDTLAADLAGIVAAPR